MVSGVGVARILWGLAEATGRLVKASLVRDLGLPSRISEVGVPEEDIDSIAAEFGDSSGEAREILNLAR